MTTTQINRTFTLPYNLEKVKEGIEVISKKSAGTYNIKSQNDIINSYHIVMTGTALTFARCNIQLKKISEEETEFRLDTIDTNPNSLYVSNETVDKFINKLTTSVQSGEVMTPEHAKKTKGGCATMVVGFIVCAVVIFFIVT
jgi:hypothetical protein